jgi:hypothetical protein
MAIAKGSNSHAEGYWTEAKGYCSHAEGHDTEANGDYSHAEGYWTKATGKYSHAEGYNTEAKGLYSHTEGYFTSAAYAYQTVVGYYNKEADARFIVGNGTSSSTRKNGFAVNKNGSFTFNGVDFTFPTTGGRILTEKDLEGYTPTVNKTIETITEEEYNELYLNNEIKSDVIYFIKEG